MKRGRRRGSRRGQSGKAEPGRPVDLHWSMERREAARELLESLLADGSPHVAVGDAVQLVEEARLQLLGLDDLVEAIDLLARSTDSCLVRDQNQAAHSRLH